MPKESTHMFLAEKLRSTLALKNPNIAALIEQNHNLFLTGSIAPDSIFNYRKGRAKEIFQKHRDYPHDTKSHNLFSFFTRIIKSDLPLKQAIAFAMGVLSHYTADAIFHPLVFYFCGREEKHSIEPTVRHYRFESELDKIMRWLFPHVHQLYIKNNFRHKELSDNDFAEALRCVTLPTEAADIIPAEELISMYKQHCSHQAYYGKALFKILTEAANLLSGNKKPELPALFYTDIKKTASKNEEAQFLEKPISFRNPASGAGCQKTINCLIDDYEQLFSEYADVVESSMKENQKEEESTRQGIAGAFEKLVPLSPSTGLPAPFPEHSNKTERMEFFEIKPFSRIFN